MTSEPTYLGQLVSGSSSGEWILDILEESREEAIQGSLADCLPLRLPTKTVNFAVVRKMNR